MVAVAATLVTAAGGARAAAVRPVAGGAGRPAGVLRERRLYRLAVLYAGTYGLSVVAANWVVELLERHSSLSDAAAAVVGALTLLLGIVSRPFGGYLMRTRPHRTVAMLRAGLGLGALGTVALAVASPAPLAVAGGVLVGVGAGWSFAPVFTGAAATRPDAPAAAVGFVNGIGQRGRARGHAAGRRHLRLGVGRPGRVRGAGRGVGGRGAAAAAAAGARAGVALRASDRSWGARRRHGGFSRDLGVIATTRRLDFRGFAPPPLTPASAGGARAARPARAPAAGAAPRAAVRAAPAASRPRRRRSAPRPSG